jgi:hypothetical protein
MISQKRTHRMLVLVLMLMLVAMLMRMFTASSFFGVVVVSAKMDYQEFV